MPIPTRQEAWDLLISYTASESLRKHGLAVEACMRAAARAYGGDEELWGICGLIHDFDYERHPDLGPDGHPFVGAKILREKGWPEELVTAVLGHATYSGIPRVSPMAKCLFAVDELAGFVMACAYVRPTRMEGMEVSSVEKNLKKKGFAAKVSREDIEQGMAELGADRASHIAMVIGALQGIARPLGFTAD